MTLRNAFDALATETTLAALLGKITNTTFGALLAGTARDRFFENFHDFDTVNVWQVVQTGTGMSINGPEGGAAAGSSPYLRIASGTTANQKTIILSRETFSAPVDFRYQVSASQRIANNRLLIGLVQVDPGTGEILTSTERATAPALLDARNAVMHMHDGTVATTGQLMVRAAGSAIDQVANAFGTGFTTVATGSTPNFLSATTYGFSFERDKINSRAWGQNVLTNTGGQFSHDRTLPNPNALYKICIIVENLGTAPASSTDWRLHLINLLDAVRFDISPRNAGTTDGAKAFSTWSAGGSVSITGTLPGLASSVNRVGFVAGAGIWYDDSAATLTANTTFTGTSRDATLTATATAFANAATYAKEIRVSAESDVAGTLWLEVSRDNIAWRRGKSVATAAVAGGGHYAEIIHRPSWRYWRVGYTNGAGAQTRFSIGSVAMAV